MQNVDMTSLIIRPIVAGAINAGILYFMGRSSNNIMDYLQTSGLQAGAVVVADLVSVGVGFSNNTPMKAMTQMALEPAISGVGYAFGAQYLFNSPQNQFMTNLMVGAGSDVASNQVVDPISELLSQ